MAGSETLRLQSSLFGSTRNYKVAWGINAPFSIHDKKKQFTKSIFCRSWISLQTSCGILCIQKMNQNLQFLYYCLLRSTDPSKVLFQFAKSYVPNPLPLFCSVLLSRLSAL
jgi:hypothetical protein